MKQEGHTLYFATSPHKEVYRQLQESPNIGLLAMDGNISVRATGHAVFDVSDDVPVKSTRIIRFCHAYISNIPIWLIFACLSPNWIITT